MPIRQAILRIHRWTGLTVGLAILFAAITGLVLLFRPQLEPLVDADVRRAAACGTRVALDTLIDNARATHPGVAIRQIEISEGGFGTTIVRFADTFGVHFDPCTGAAFDARSRWAGPFNRVEQLHRWRFLADADVAETITGSVALTCALAMGLGGITVWWPSTRRQWKGAWKLRPGLKGAAFEINLHRTYGAYAAVILIATTLSAQTLAFEWPRRLIDAVTGSPAHAKKPAASTASGTPQPMEALLTRALAAVPAARDVTLSGPRKAGESVEAIIIERGAPHPNARTLVSLDPYTGAVLRVQPYATASTGYKVYRWLASLHMGYIGGVFGQLVLFFGILAVPVLGYTGIRSYFRRQQRPQTQP